MLPRLCTKSFKLGFSSTWSESYQIYNLNLEKVVEPEIKLQSLVGIWRKKKSSRKKKKIYFCFIDYAKVFDCVDHKTLENT